MHVLECSQRLDLPASHAFAFYGDPLNLEPWLGFRVVTPGPLEMRPGKLLDYRLRLHGVPVRWRDLERIFDYRRHAVAAALTR